MLSVKLAAHSGSHFALLAALLLVFASAVQAQTPGGFSIKDNISSQLPVANPEQEQQDLAKAVNEASASGVDLIRLFEAHLKKYPGSPQRVDLGESHRQGCHGNQGRCPGGAVRGTDPE